MKGKKHFFFQKDYLMYILVKENTSIYNKLIKDKIYFKNYKKTP